eukprot:2214215-Rhodomonas_salina.2
MSAMGVPVCYGPTRLSAVGLRECPLWTYVPLSAMSLRSCPRRLTERLLKSAMGLGACYEMSGAETAYDATRAPPITWKTARR